MPMLSWETRKQALSIIIEAADMAEQLFPYPIYLMKAGMIYENEGKYAEALKLYERIQDKYAESNEGRSIDKYIARVKLPDRLSMWQRGISQTMILHVFLMLRGMRFGIVVADWNQ
ncbi:MAG: hypothetical protein MZV63_23440 [Marinilabiliales bacterium]|nr:hypothetical protein [Marinilabiliales bacterium]